MAGIPGKGIISIATEKFETLMSMAVDSENQFLSVSRIVLHRLLAKGLDDIIHYDHRYERMESLDSGKIRVHFANGKCAEGDVLVAADGVNSSLRKQLLPESFEPTKYGVAGAVGKVFLDTKNPVNVDPFKQGPCIVTSMEGRGLFVASQQYSVESKAKINDLFSGDTDGVTHETQLSPNAKGDNLLLINDGTKQKLVDDARDYVFYAYITKYTKQDFGLDVNGSLKSISQRDLLDAVLKQMKERNWSPTLMELVEKTDVSTLGYWPLRMSPKITKLSDYKPANITFLGDSIHASMSSRRLR